MARDGSNVWSPPAGTTATPGTTIESAKYNALVADLTNLANEARPISAGGTGASTAAAALSNLGLTIGTNVQAYDADLTAIAGLTSAADRVPYYTGAGTASLATFTAAGRALVDDADAAAQRATLGLVIGTNVQAYDAALASLAGLSLVAGDIVYATGADTLVRLAKGTALQGLRMNAGATAPEWGDQAIGVGQTWQNVIGSRAVSTSYQNTTGRPIQVYIDANSTVASGRPVEVSTDNATWVQVSQTNGSAGGFVASAFIVSNNHYYRVNGAATLKNWAELR